MPWHHQFSFACFCLFVLFCLSFLFFQPTSNCKHSKRLNINRTVPKRCFVDHLWQLRLWSQFERSHYPFNSHLKNLIPVICWVFSPLLCKLVKWFHLQIPDYISDIHLIFHHSMSGSKVWSLSFAQQKSPVFSTQIYCGYLLDGKFK